MLHHVPLAFVQSIEHILAFCSQGVDAEWSWAAGAARSRIKAAPFFVCLEEKGVAQERLKRAELDCSEELAWTWPMRCSMVAPQQFGMFIGSHNRS
jgi:hypothetical protein